MNVKNMETRKEKKIVFYLSLSKFSDNDISSIEEFFEEIIYYLKEDRTLMKGLENSAMDFKTEYMLKFLKEIREKELELPSIEYLIKYLSFIKSREVSDEFGKEYRYKHQGRPNKINEILKEYSDIDFLDPFWKETIIIKYSKSTYYRALKKWRKI